ncbi:MAG: hypothetical protein PHD61_06965 [Bacteroidales bacterium]|nr:hypothetical protein [Lentimicrobiaceae bacterium]MDD5695029.1 hypothetical protein [Bacteroidales bacterium]
MEDWIYILLGIVWIVYAAYRSNQKQKKKVTAPPQHASPPQPAADHQPSTLETVFQEILGESASLETTYPVEAESYDERTIQELELEKRLYNKQEIPLETIPTEEGISAFRYDGDKTTVFLSGGDEEDTAVSKEFLPFDLRKAILYSEIMNRPYR